MKEEIEQYLELATFLRDPNNANISEGELDEVLDRMDELWYNFTIVERAEIEKLTKELI